MSNTSLPLQAQIPITGPQNIAGFVLEMVSLPVFLLQSFFCVVFLSLRICCSANKSQSKRSNSSCVSPITMLGWSMLYLSLVQLPISAVYAASTFLPGPFDDVRFIGFQSVFNAILWFNYIGVFFVATSFLKIWLVLASSFDILLSTPEALKTGRRPLILRFLKAIRALVFLGLILVNMVIIADCIAFSVLFALLEYGLMDMPLFTTLLGAIGITLAVVAFMILVIIVVPMCISLLVLLRKSGRILQRQLRGLSQQSQTSSQAHHHHQQAKKANRAFVNKIAQRRVMMGKIVLGAASLTAAMILYAIGAIVYLIRFIQGTGLGPLEAPLRDLILLRGIPCCIIVHALLVIFWPRALPLWLCCICDSNSSSESDTAFRKFVAKLAKPMYFDEKGTDTATDIDDLSLQSQATVGDEPGAPKVSPIPEQSVDDSTPSTEAPLQHEIKQDQQLQNDVAIPAGTEEISVSAIVTEIQAAEPGTPQIDAPQAEQCQ